MSGRQGARDRLRFREIAALTVAAWKMILLPALAAVVAIILAGVAVRFLFFR